VIDVSNVKAEHLWYFVGLIATDGNLSPDGRHIAVVSKDIQHLENIREIFKLPKIGRKASGTTKEKMYGVLQFGDVRFYRFLQSIGIPPKKSLVLREIAVPPKYFKDFLRGVIDGDGSVRKWKHPTNGGEQWEVKVVSGTLHFTRWLQKTIKKHFKVTGIFITYPATPKQKHPLYVIKYGKMAAQKILSCYTPSALALARKGILARECMRTKSGWSRSFTVLK